MIADLIVIVAGYLVLLAALYVLPFRLQNKPKVIVVIGMTAVFVTTSATWLHSIHTDCARKNAMLGQRVDSLRREASGQLRTGVEKAVVLRFFTNRQIRVKFADGEATGAFSASGCMSGCGYPARIKLSVPVDPQGTVTGQPKVNAEYTDCM